MSWRCAKCSYVNRDNDPAICANCGKPGDMPYGATDAGWRDPAAKTLASKKEYLVKWVEGIFCEAGIAPVKEHVESVARTAAAGLFVSRVLAFADSRPLPTLQNYCRSLPGDYSARLDQFDEIYVTWIRLGAEADAGTQDPSNPAYARFWRQHAEMVDQVIERCLADSRASFIEGIRDDDGQPRGEGAYILGFGESLSGGSAPVTGSMWETVKGQARQAQQHVNPVALQHGIEAVQGALTEARIAKVDKNTGRMKIKKVGVARAALQPAKTLRRALDGAALAEHLKAYNETSQSAMGGPLRGSEEVGRAIAARSPAEFASYGSKRDYFRDWARRLIVAAGLPPTEHLVVEHASMAASAVARVVFLRVGASRGISHLSQYFRDGVLPDGTPLDTVDVLYARVVEVTAGQQMIDEGIVAFLDSRWNDWIEGIRQRYG
jgi:hypothetical protein